MSKVDFEELKATLLLITGSAVSIGRTNDFTYVRADQKHAKSISLALHGMGLPSRGDNVGIGTGKAVWSFASSHITNWPDAYVNRYR